jgi:hypothetical protein
LAKLWNVNEIVMGRVEGSNRAAAVAAADSFNEIVGNPRIEMISEVLTRDVGPFFARQGEELVVYVEKGHAIDIDHELNVLLQGMANGCVSRNEYRERNGLARMEGGDSVIIGGQVIPVEVEREKKLRINPGRHRPERPAQQSLPRPPRIADDGVALQDEGLGEAGTGAVSASVGQVKDLTLAHNPGQFEMPAFRPSWGQLLGTAKIFDLWLKRQAEAERMFRVATANFFAEMGQRVRGVMSENHGPNVIYPASVDLAIDSLHWVEKYKEACRGLLIELVAFGALLEWEVHRHRNSLSRQPKCFSLSLHTKGWTDFVKIPGQIVARIRGAVAGLLSADHWGHIIETVKKKSRAALTSAMNAGKRGAEALDSMVRHVFGSGSKDHVDNIAITESVTALNSGAHAAREELARRGLISGQQWNTQEDEKVRPSHRLMNGVIVGVGQPWNLNGHPALYPGDPTLPAEERCNCRCYGSAVAA